MSAPSPRRSVRRDELDACNHGIGVDSRRRYGFDGQRDAAPAKSSSRGAVVALAERKLRTPEDVRLVGYDDRPWAEHMPVPLTTVALPQEQMGELAATLLFAQIDGSESEGGIHAVAPTLVVRNSA